MQGIQKDIDVIIKKQKVSFWIPKKSVSARGMRDSEHAGAWKECGCAASYTWGGCEADTSVGTSVGTRRMRGSVGSWEQTGDGLKIKEKNIYLKIF